MSRPSDKRRAESVERKARERSRRQARRMVSVRKLAVINEVRS